MKVRKYNESAEEWSFDRIKQHIENKKKIREEENTLRSYILSYLLYANFQLLPKKLQIEFNNPGDEGYNFTVGDILEISLNNSIIIGVSWEDDEYYDYVKFDKDTLEDFNKYIANPKLYSDMKKYNL